MFASDGSDVYDNIFNGTRNMLGDLEQKSSMFFWFNIIGNSQKKSCNKETETEIIRTLLINHFLFSLPRARPHEITIPSQGPESVY